MFWDKDIERGMESALTNNAAINYFNFTVGNAKHNAG
jgi:hypothetical protein